MEQSLPHQLFPTHPPKTPHLSPLPSCSPHLEMRLTAALAVRGGKNSRENHLSPESCRRRIFSRSRSCRSASRTGVEQRELSLELSLPLLLPPSDLELELVLQVCWLSLTMLSNLEGSRRCTVGTRQNAGFTKEQLPRGGQQRMTQGSLSQDSTFLITEGLLFASPHYKLYWET